MDFDAPVSDGSTSTPVILGTEPEAPPQPAPAGASTAAPNDAKQQPAGDVIVLQVRQLKISAWVIAGGLIGAILAGALVVPFFGQAALLLGSVAGIVTILGSAWIGLRVGTVAVDRQA